MLRRFGVFLGLILADFLFIPNTHATEINSNNYEIYVGDINNDGYKDFYFHGKPLWLILSGDIITPIPLNINLDFIVYGANNNYTTPVVSSLSSTNFSNLVASGNLVLAISDRDYYLSAGDIDGQTNILLVGNDANSASIMLASFSTTVLPLVTQISQSAASNTPGCVYSSGNVTSYCYDEIGRVISVRHANGVINNYTYDQADNRTQKVSN